MKNHTQNRQNNSLRLEHGATWDVTHTEVGIYKRKQESKKAGTRPIKRSRKQEGKQELDQESDQEKKKTTFFLDHFLGRVLVFLLSCFLL